MTLHPCPKARFPTPLYTFRAIANDVVEVFVRDKLLMGDRSCLLL